MKKILALLALATSGFAPAFADAPVCAKPETQQPVAPQTTPSKPVEVKKIAAIADEEQGTPEKPKMMFASDEVACCCPSDKKEEQKTPAQTPVKTTAPKIALA